MSDTCRNITLNNKPPDVPDNFLVSNSGGSNKITASNSNYFEQINTMQGLRGRSRRWGDVDIEVQKQVAQSILAEAEKNCLTKSEAAFLLALVRTESGFNPDAANQSTSASGLGQFISSTGRAYGLDKSNRFSAEDNLNAIIRHFMDLKKLVQKKQKDISELELFQSIYTLYHDGPNKEQGGRDIAQNKVMPWFNKFSQWLKAGE